MKTAYQYEITCTLEQLRLIQKISECFLRERIGQYNDLADDIAGEGCEYKYDRSDPDHSQKFNDYIGRRKMAEDYFYCAFTLAKTNHMKTQRVLMAEDFYEEIRHAIWKAQPDPKRYYINDAYPSLNWAAPEPIPECHVNGEMGTIKVTETQLKLLQDMSENYMRERMGQFWLLADDLAFEGSGFDYGEEKNTDRFNECIENRNAAQQMFETGYKISGCLSIKTKRMMMAYDIYSVIRNAIWQKTKDPANHLAKTVLHECREVPLIQVTAINNVEGGQ